MKRYPDGRTHIEGRRILTEGSPFDPAAAWQLDELTRRLLNARNLMLD